MQNGFEGFDEEGDDIFYFVLSNKGRLQVGEELLALADDAFVYEAVQRTKQRLRQSEDKKGMLAKVVKIMLIERRKAHLLKRQAALPLVRERAQALGLAPIEQVFGLFLCHILSRSIDLGLLP